MSKSSAESMSFFKNKHVGISTSLANKTYVNWTACARPDCGWSCGGGSLWAAILTPLRACVMVAAMERDLLLGRFAKIWGGHTYRAVGARSSSDWNGTRPAPRPGLSEVFPAHTRAKRSHGDGLILLRAVDVTWLLGVVFGEGRSGCAGTSRSSELVVVTTRGRHLQEMCLFVCLINVALF